MNYEINFLILQSQTENIPQLRKKVKDLIKKNEGTITDELVYQKRKLAFEIKHEQYGFYTVYRFDLEDGTKLKDLTKDLNLEKGVARHIIVKSNEIPKLQKEIGKAPKTEEERKVEKNAPKKKIGKKVLDDISKETTANASNKKSKSGVKTPSIEKVVKTKTELDKAEITEDKKDGKKEEKIVAKKKPTKVTKKEEISMDDLDKKLDEILDI